jgi:prepilin-type N-terminal cleavage/methylation domain-containing protein|tara:strand:- start:1353 stop:2042 length:690 start_codon:yes stop_codon:yes gene_type:complete
MRRIKYKAFTIIELLVVLAIIGIFSAIAYPNVSSWITDREVKKEVYDVVNLINERKSDVMNGKYGMVQIRLKPGVEIYNMSQDHFFNTYKNITSNNKFKTNKICDYQWRGRGMSTLVRDRTAEMSLSVNSKESKVYAWQQAEAVMCITKEGIIKFSSSYSGEKNLSEQDPNSGERIEYFIFCSKTNTTQRTCKRNIKKDYQYKITWNRIINQIKVYKYRKDDEWVLIDG